MNFFAKLRFGNFALARIFEIDMINFSTLHARVLNNAYRIHNGTQSRILWQKSFRLMKSREEH